MCTGILLKSNNQDIVKARTLEWQGFSMQANIEIYPRNHLLLTNNITNQHAFLAATIHIDSNINRDIIIEGINEYGLCIGTFYHKNYVDLPNQGNVDNYELPQYILGLCKNIDDVKNNIHKINIKKSKIEMMHFTIEMHFIVVDKNNNCIVIEFINQEVVITDHPIGVITNGPLLEWQLTNLQHNLHLFTHDQRECGTLNGVKLEPIGGYDTSLISLPGDYSSVSRFIRAAALVHKARKTVNGEDAAFEAFKILDSFNVPIYNPALQNVSNVKSATIITTAIDITNMDFYFHTQHNRRITKINLNNLSEASYKKISLRESNDVDILAI